MWHLKKYEGGIFNYVLEKIIKNWFLKIIIETNPTSYMLSFVFILKVEKYNQNMLDE